ncbi:MAG: PQQ-binding-like beta-propeller repeat protein, partial [Planctomycetota bacterium]
AASGKMLWRKNDFEGAWPKFFTSSSPMFADGVCVAQLGGAENGGIVAYDPATGGQKWKWTGDGTAYASPTLLTAGETKMVVALTEKKIVCLALSDGKLCWEAPFVGQARAYNCATPIVDGQTVIYSGAARGAKAVKLEKAGGGFAAKELWSNPEAAVQFNNPILKSGQVYGISQKGELFCLDAQSGKTQWTAPLTKGGFGSIVDAGAVLMSLTPEGELAVFEPSDKEYKKLAGYKVGTDTYAYPVVAGNRVFVKDKDSVALWTIE